MICQLLNTDIFQSIFCFNNDNRLLEIIYFHSSLLDLCVNVISFSGHILLMRYNLNITNTIWQAIQLLFQMNLRSYGQNDFFF